MQYFIGAVIGALLIAGAIAFAIRTPAKPLKKRSDVEQDAWNDTHGISGLTTGDYSGSTHGDSDAGDSD